MADSYPMTMAGGGVGGGSITYTFYNIDQVGSLDATLPNITLDALASCFYVWLDATLFKITLDAGVNEYFGSLDATLPAITLDAAIDGSVLTITGQADLTLPAITLDAKIKDSYTVLQSDEEVIGLALCLNVESGALTEFSNYGFNSFAFINGKYVGANENGLFELEGDDDNGTLINANLRLAANNFGVDLLKRMWNAYLGHKNAGDFTLKLIASEGIEYDGVALPKIGDGFKVQQVKLNRRHKGNYWGVEYKNVDGSDFEIDSVDLTCEMLNRRA